MVEKFPTEQQVGDALYECSGDIFNMVDVLRFLNNSNLMKDNGQRFICYLISLKIMPIDRPTWIPTLLKCGSFYEDIIRRYFDDCYEKPISAVFGPIAKEIEEGVHSKFEWCMGFGCQLKIEPYHISDAEIRVKRIFAAYAKEIAGAQYLPEYVLFAYISYLVSLMFAIQSGISHFFAEAIGYKIFLSLTKIHKYNQQLLDLKYTEEHFKKLDELLAYFAPQAKKAIDQSDLNFQQIILCWEFSLYTDEHVPINLLLIWDHIMFHIDEFQFFMRFLHLAHLRQMEEAKIDFTSKKSIESMPWNAVKIIKDVDDLMEKDIGRVNFNWMSLCPCYGLCPFLRHRKT